MFANMQGFDFWMKEVKVITYSILRDITSIVSLLCYYSQTQFCSYEYTILNQRVHFVLYVMIASHAIHS